jgi:hypothetical protein
MRFGMPTGQWTYRERRFVSCALEITTTISVVPAWWARLALAGR